MYTEKNKITNPFVIFRSIVLCCGMHPLYVLAPSIHGVKVALLPGCPPGYPSPLPRETIVWAVSDRSSTIDSSSGYYTVRTMRLYAHGQTSELLAVNVLTGQKTGTLHSCAGVQEGSRARRAAESRLARVSTGSPLPE